MGFAADIRHWPTVAAFRAHLAQHDPAICGWVRGLTYHHTYRPTVKQWAGEASMRGLLRYYRDDLGWPAAPHLFIGPDGIWQLTPLDARGVHATICNTDRWGIEVVGDYDLAVWPEPIRALALGAGAALLSWRGLPAAAANGHRDCNSPKTCPGRAIDLAWVRAQLMLLLAASNAGGLYSPDSPLYGPSRATVAQAARYIQRLTAGTYTAGEISQIILPAYARLCARFGLVFEDMLGQVCLETDELSSPWAQRPHRNPAGIGVTGVPGEGVSFASWVDDAIPAHVGRRIAYAKVDAHCSADERALVAKALSYRDLPAHYRGCAPTLAGLSGRWATDPVYATKVAAIANAIRSQ